MRIFIEIVSMLATIAFSISGAYVAIRKEMDLFGVTILGLTTAIGGGIIRDCILNIAPPTMLVEIHYPLIAIVTALIIFIPPVRHRFNKMKFLKHDLILWIDSIGLGIFTVVGVETVIDAGYEKEYFLQIFLAAMTGCGGGIMRDIMAGNIPHIFVRHFYASASIAGAIVCIVLYNLVSPVVGMISGAVVCIILRLLAAHFRWNMPRAHREIDDEL